jgi:hypothetical protein
MMRGLKTFVRKRRAGVAAPGNDGFIIVAVLWILVALTTLVSIYTVYSFMSA